MPKPKWEETEEIQDIPKFEDTEEIEVKPEEELSQIEAVARAGGQGVTAGFLDELIAGLKAGGVSPRQEQSQPVSESVKQLRDISKKYEEEVGKQREQEAKLREEYPGTMLGAEIAGGIIPAVLTGGGSAAAAVARGAGKPALAQAAKLGGQYGATSGLGYSEGETPGEVLKDVGTGTLTGIAAGVALPLIGNTAVKGAKKLGDAGKGVLNLIPESESIKAGYKFGREGKALTQEVIDDDLVQAADKILTNLKDTKSKGSLTDIKNKLDAIGIKVDTEVAMKSAIDDLEKIKAGERADVYNKDILPTLRQMAGISLQEEKLAERATKSAIKKGVQASGKPGEAIIKGEKALAKRALQGADELETVSDVTRKMDDLEIPFDTPEGQFAGTKGKFTTPEGKTYTKEMLQDVTEFQPKMEKVLGPDGRPILKTTDLGTGKVSALVGDIENRIQSNINDMTVSEAEAMRKQLTIAIKKAGKEGDFSDPIIQRASKLTSQLRDITDEAIEKHGGGELPAARKRMSDLLASEKLMGIKKTKEMRADLSREERIDQIGKKFGFKQGWIDRREGQRATRLAGEDVIPASVQDRFRLIQELNSVLGRESQETITRAGLYKTLAGKVPNMAGRAVKRTADFASPVTKARETITNLTDEQLGRFANRLATSETPGLKMIGNRLLEAGSMEGAAKQQMLWSLSQSPAMRELIKREADKMPEMNLIEEAGASELWPPRSPESPSERSEYVTRPDALEEDLEASEGVREPSRAPASVSAIKEQIAKGEGTTDEIARKKGYESGYDVTLEYGDYDPEGYDKPITQMSLGELKEFQKGMLADPNNPHDSSAVGKYQIVRTTLQEMQDKLGLSDDELFSPEVQDRMAEALLERRGYEDFQAGGLPKEDFINNLSKEWASVYSPKKGGSYYGGQNVGTTLDEISQAIDVPETSVSAPGELDSPDIIDKVIDRVNKQQSSGDATPVDQLEELMDKINRLRLPQQQIDELENDAAMMDGFGQGQQLKDKLRRLLGA